MKIINVGFISVPSLLKRNNSGMCFVLINKDTNEWLACGFHGINIIKMTMDFLKSDYDSNKHLFHIGKLYKNVLDFKREHKDCKIIVDSKPIHNVRFTKKRLDKINLLWETRND